MSDIIADHTYDPDTDQLTITFVKGGNKAVYSGVPPEKYQDFLDAGSKGKFFHQNIRGQHDFAPG